MLIISGMHSSGTSLVARYAQHIGYHMGFDPEKWVSTFYPTYEDPQFQQCSMEILDSMKWNEGPPRYFPRDVAPPSDGLIQKMRAILRRRRGEAWGFKEPANCFTMGFWLPELQRAGFRPAVLHVFRRPEEVINSMTRWRPELNSHDAATHDRVEAWWRVYNMAVIDRYWELRGTIPFAFVDVREVTALDARLCAWLGRSYSPIAPQMNNGQLQEAPEVELHPETVLIWNELSTLMQETLIANTA
ncbi:MAG: hypothetical protein GC146_06420 [Limimaricola sp.]|uniref:hypothetical protein n=1 Tax=Limimaricola sp. TaxID=2211665 RepID=UPI001D44C129|nr:hypothetical protein [Limimaricola sp.]MBI1416842.1 hypothetical protein [Limimaricola sp.]